MALLAPKLDISRLQYEQSYGDRAAFNPEAGYLPQGFPSAFPTKLAWNGSTLTDERCYTFHLTEDDISEIEAALFAFKALELDGDLVDNETFPLPTLRHVFKDLCNDIHNGKGFFVLRGLDLRKYSVEDGMVIFLGIQSYVGEQRARQDDNGNMVVHIISDSTAAASPAKSLHARHSTKSIAFHTEETGDIIAWQTRNTAARGGRCIISSAHTIYNVLAATRPDIIQTLAQPDWPFALPHFHRRAVLFYHKSRLIINYCPAALLGSAAHPRPSHLPSLTPQQRSALDAVEVVARATELKITTRPGDLHFINNLAVLHRRDEFVDAAVPAPVHRVSDWGCGADGQGADKLGPGDGKNEPKKRHLVRMRIRNRERGWELPPCLVESWEEVFGEEGEQVWHLEPMPEGFFPLRKYPL